MMDSKIAELALLTLLKPGEGVVLNTGLSWVYVYRLQHGVEADSIQVAAMDPRPDLPHGALLRIPRYPVGVQPTIPPRRMYGYQVEGYHNEDMGHGPMSFDSYIPDLENHPELWEGEIPYAMGEDDTIIPYGR
jgi:hypothetical protein